MTNAPACIAKRVLGRGIVAFASRRIVTGSIRRAIADLRDAHTAESAIDWLYSPALRYVRPWQHRGELLALAHEIERRRPKVVVEIGTAAGGTLLLAACLADPDAVIASIDLPSGPFGGGYPEWKMPLYRAFARRRQRIELIRGDSHSDEIFEALRSALGGRAIDYLFIDGDHSYAGVRSDFERYRTLLADGAMVAFHDIAVDRSETRSHFVSDYWDEIRPQYAHREFIDDPLQDKCGIGVLTYRS